jgi:hypothetical protein
MPGQAHAFTLPSDPPLVHSAPESFLGDGDGDAGFVVREDAAFFFAVALGGRLPDGGFLSTPVADPDEVLARPLSLASLLGCR